MMYFDLVRCIMQDLSKYTVPKSFVGIAVPIKVMGMLVVAALATKFVGVNHVICSTKYKKAPTPT